MGNKLIHIVGGGFNQVPLVQKVKELGFRVLVTDMYDHPPCLDLADHYEQIDTTDKEKTLGATCQYKADFIVTDQTDVAVPTVAFIAEKLGMPGIGYETALRFTNKYLMRECLREKLPFAIPEFHFFNSPAAARDFLSASDPADEWIVKPINSQGSKGVFRIGRSQAGEAVSAAYLESKSRGILVERFLHGFEYSVEGFRAPGKMHNLALTKKYHYNSNDCIDERNTWLADVPADLEEKLFSLNTKVVEALGLPFGITHAEYKVSGGQPYLIEIAARGGGGSISSRIIPFLTGFEPADALIRLITGMDYAIHPQDYKKRFAVLKFFNLKPGRVKRIHQLTSAREGLLEFTLSLQPGDVIREVKDSRDRPGYFVVAGYDRKSVLEKEKQVEESIQIEYA